MERREFLKLSAGLLAASQLPLRLNAQVKRYVSDGSGTMDMIQRATKQLQDALNL